MKIRQLTLSAMLVAIVSVIIFIDSRFSYAFSSYLGFILPVPIILLGLNEDIKTASITSIAITILLFITGSIIPLVYVIPALLIGIATVFIIQMNVKTEKAFIYYMILNLSFVLIQYYFLTYLLKIEAELGSDVAIMLKQFNVSVSSFDLQLILVLVILVLALLQCVIVLMLVKIIQFRLFKKNNIDFNLSYLHFNRIFGIISIGMLLFYLNNHLFKASAMIQFITVSLVGIIIVLNVSIGCSVISYYLVQNQKSKWIGLLLIACLIPIVLLLVMGLGVVDSMYDIRRRIV